MVPIKLLRQGRDYTFAGINIPDMHLHAWIFVMIYAWTASKIYEIIGLKVKEHTKGDECVPRVCQGDTIPHFIGFFLTESEKKRGSSLRQFLAVK